MSVNQVKEEKTKSLFLYLFILCLACLHWSNPNVDSFKSYIRRQAAHYSGPFGCILSNLNVWYAQKTNSLQVHNLIFFSFINAPPYLMEILDSTNGRQCVFVGLLGNWVPVCFSKNLRLIPKVSQCSFRGLELVPGMCCCLPSWKGDDCSRAVFNFKPFFGKKFGSIAWLQAISILEVVLIGLVAVEAFCLIIALKRRCRSRMLCTWNGLMHDLKLHTLLVHCFVHKNLFHFLFGLCAFVMYAARLYELVGDGKFILLFGAMALCSTIASVVCRKVQRTFYSVRFVGLSAVNLGMRGILAFAAMDGYTVDDLVLTLGQVLLTHSVVEYMIVGESFDFAALVGGLLSGILAYKSI